MRVEKSMEKVRCHYNPTSDVLVVEREGGEIRDVSCKFISKIDGLCSQIKSECIYYENLPEKRDEKKQRQLKLAEEWVQYLERIGKGKEWEKKWYAMTPEERTHFKKQFIEEMKDKGWTNKDICLFREHLNFWD